MCKMAEWCYGVNHCIFESEFCSVHTQKWPFRGFTPIFKCNYHSRSFSFIVCMRLMLLRINHQIKNYSFRASCELSSFALTGISRALMIAEVEQTNLNFSLTRMKKWNANAFQALEIFQVEWRTELNLLQLMAQVILHLDLQSSRNRFMSTRQQTVERKTEQSLKYLIAMSVLNRGILILTKRPLVDLTQAQIKTRPGSSCGTSCKRDKVKVSLCFTRLAFLHSLY